MKMLLLLAALGLASLTATTQAQVLAPPLAPAPLALAVPDTAAALHRLFVAKRRLQGYVVGGTAVVAVGTFIGLASSRPEPGPSNPNFAVYSGGNAPDLVVNAILTLPTILVAAVAFGGWGHRQEQRALTNWQQQHQLPRQIRRKLRPRYFQNI